MRAVKKWRHFRVTVYGCAACSVVGAVHLGIVQGAVSHAVYRLRSVPATVRLRRLADDHQHAHWSDVLRALRRSIDDTDTDV